MKSRLVTIAQAWQVASLVGWVVLVAFVLGAASPARAATSDAEAAASAPAPRLEQRRDTPQTSVDEVSREVMCPSCDTTLDQSNSPAAERMRAWVASAVAAGWTEEEIRDGLVEEYGGEEAILATPRANGLGLLAWLVPAIVALIALVGGFVLVRRWRSDARPPAAPGDESDQTRSGSSA